MTAASLTYFAVQSKGETVHEADLNDGGVWVTSTKLAKFAKLNKPAGQFDQGVATSLSPGSGLDVLQDGSAVVGLYKSTSQLVPIDPRTGRLDESAAVVADAPASATNQQVFAPATADLRGGTIAKIDPKTGKVFAQRVDTRGGVGTLEGLSVGAKPLATVGAVAALAVDVHGGVHAVSGATGKVVSLKATATGFAKPVTETIKLEAKAVDITAVGERWVVYNPVDDQVFAEGLDEAVDGGVPRTEGSVAYAALQQPGPEAESVALQSAEALRMVGIGGSPENGGIEIQESLEAGQPGRMISRPLRLGSCVHGAWAETMSAHYGVNCGQEAAVGAATLEKVGDAPLRDGMQLRTNRGLVVLNDLDTGGLWDLDSKPIKIDNWDALIPPPKADKDNPNKDKNIIDEASTPQPPKAQPDNLKARPGRTSKLHVLDNDTDTTGAILAIAPGDVTTPSMDGVSVSVAADGQSVDVSIPREPKEPSFTFKYSVNNGTAAKKAQGTVTVRIAGDNENTKPHLRPGTATLANTQYPVVFGKRLPVQVIGDWRDPESDTLTVEAAEATSSVDGLGRLNVQAPQEEGPKAVPYRVSDGHGGKTDGKVNLQVLGKEAKLRAPKTQPDVVRGVVGKPLQVEPLGNDVSGADPAEPDAKLRLATEVRSTGSLVSDTNLDTGVVTITGSAAGTFELGYSAQVGGGVAPGRIRVDLVADPDPEAPPVAVPDSATIRDQTPVLTDVLANDYSPRADVLVTQSVTVESESSWLRPSIYKGRWVRVEALEPATSGASDRTGTVKYTISDGTKSTTGEIAVSQKAALDNPLPIVQDDEALVRAQDSVTIPVMDNDSMAEGIPLVLDPASVKVIKGNGSAFASGNVVRFVPKDRTPTVEQVQTIEYAVYPIGMKGRAQTGRVTVTVKPLPTEAQPNQPPTARSFSSTVVAGEPLTVTVPTSGVDVDGDSVTVAGLVGEDGDSVDLSLGRVTSFGPSTIKYEAYPRAAGTEVLHYEVTDRWGAKSTGFIRIGVVPPSDPQPPVAVEDEVRAAPGKTVNVDVTENDLIARGDSIKLEYDEPLNPKASLAKWKVDAENTQFSTRVPDAESGVQQLTYGITNGLFDPSRASVAVLPVPNFVNPPVAVDDVAKPKPDQTTALVDVLANDRDIDGDRSSLKVKDVLSPDGAVEGRQVRVKILDHPHTVPYVITDEDGATAMALIYVPTGSDGAPFVASGALIEMDKNSTKSVKLGDYVKSPRARVVGITTSETLSASPRENLSVEAEGKDTLTLESLNNYVGPAAVMVEVSDQETLDQKEFGTAYVSIPVQIGPKVPLLRCPDYAVRVIAAGRPRTFDIPTLCHAWVPPGMTLDDVVFDARWEPEPKGVELKQDGAAGREVEVKANRDAPAGKGRIRIQARGAEEVSHVNVTVVPLGSDAVTTGLTDADADGGPPRMRPFTVTGLKAGSSQTVDLRGYLDSPLEKPECTIESAAPEGSSGLTLSHSGCSLKVTASPEAKGSATIAVSVSDGPGRSAAGRGTVDILGRPGAPTAVAAVADRVNGGTARVRWAPPAYDGGAPITHYTVSWRGPKSGQLRCTASPCTIGGLENGKNYWFTVTATNAVGDSEPSAEAGPAMPDTLPNPVSGVRMISRGDQKLVIGWSKPAPKGSEIKSYTVRVTDTTSGTPKNQTVPASSLQATVAGLVNNHQQSVQVRATNALGAGPFGPAVTMQSAGTPPAVGKPVLSPRGPGAAQSSEALKISWGAVSPNGPALTKYTVYRKVGGGAWSARTTTSPDTRTWTDSLPYDGRTYTYVVTATNGANHESAKANTASFRAVAPPVQPAQPRASTPRANKGATVSVTLRDSRGSGYTRLEWDSTRAGGGFVSCGCAEGATKTFGVTGLSVSSQQFRVRVFNGVSWSPWSVWSNSVTPYGATPRPTAGNSTVNDRQITFRWNLPTNGRPITRVKVRGPGGTTYNSARRYHVVNGSWDTPYTIYVSAYSAAGWSGELRITKRTAKPPQPSLTVFQDGYGSDPGGTDSCRVSCEKVGIKIANYPPNRSYSVRCSHTKNGSFTSSEKLRTNGSGDGYTWYGSCLFNKNGGTVTVTVGPASDSAPW